MFIRRRCRYVFSISLFDHCHIFSTRDARFASLSPFFEFTPLQRSASSLRLSFAFTCSCRRSYRSRLPLRSRPILYRARLCHTFRDMLAVRPATPLLPLPSTFFDEADFHSKEPHAHRYAISCFYFSYFFADMRTHQNPYADARHLMLRLKRRAHERTERMRSAREDAP